MRRTACAVLVAIAFIATACSSGTNSKSGNSSRSKTTTTLTHGEWDRPSAVLINGLADKIQHAYAGECADPGTLPHDQYVANVQAVHLDVPMAVSDCTAFKTTLEFNAFADAQARDAYMKQRTDVLCARALKAKVPIPGLHWVTADRIAIQAETEAVGKKIATAVGGTYHALACSGQPIDWEPGAEQRVETIAQMLAARRGIGCTDFTLADRDVYSRNAGYYNRLPAAYAQCHGPAGSTIWIAAFSSTSTPRDTFLAGETKYLCGSQKSITVVEGNDWAVLTSEPKVAQLAAVATGGTAKQPACG